jgi:ribosome-binding protein aMBF1 (putative translation factor)
MALNKKIAAFTASSKQSDSYWVESAKLDFSIEMENRRKRAVLSYADIAAKIGSSAAYITKVFKGDVNFTIESMVKLSRSTGGKLHIKIVDEHAKIDSSLWVGKLHTLKAANVNYTPIETATTVEEFREAA